MDNHLIYMHINVLNHKIYIGQTNKIKKPNYRWQNGHGYKNCPRFYEDIQKYGWDKFEHLILATDLTKEEADNLEQYYINRYNTGDPTYGYNLRSTGHFDTAKLKQIPHGNAKPVKCIETQQIFNTAQDAAEWCGLKSGSNIAMVCRGQRKIAGKHPITKIPLHWKYVESI